MPNDLSQDGIGNIGIQGLSGPTVNITQIIGKSPQFQDLCEQLEICEKLFALIPEDDLDERLKISKKVNQFKDLIRQFKDDVLRLAEQFEKNEINSERIKQAKEFFDKGEIGEARAILEADIEQMNDEHLHLIRQRERFENEILPQLKNNSDEFYILALSKQTDYADADWFANTCTYFEKSIAAFPAKKNVFQYALFLKKHNQFSKAESFYQKYLTDFASAIDLWERAMTLNNLGNLHSNKNEYEDALKEYAEALEIYRKLAAENPSVYLSDVAGTLNNLGILHRARNEYEDALKEYVEALEIRRKLAAENPSAYLPYVAMTLNNLAGLHWNKNEYEDAQKEVEEALEIYRKLAAENPSTYLPYVAATLNNLGNLHSDRNEYQDALKEFEEALEIRRKLTAENPSAYLPYVATTLNNLAGLHWNKNEYEDAQKEVEEALEIYRKLAAENPSAYLPYVAMTLINLGIFYQTAIEKRQYSIDCLIEAVIIVRPIVENVPYTQKYLQNALASLRVWELSDEDIEKLIAQRLADEED